VDPAEWKKFLAAKLGKPRHVKDASYAKDRTGILYFEGVAGKSSAGHLDLWNGHETRSVADYWTESTDIWLFELQAE